MNAGDDHQSDQRMAEKGAVVERKAKELEKNA